jgi:hypothetical protein
LEWRRFLNSETSQNQLDAVASQVAQQLGHAMQGLKVHELRRAASPFPCLSVAPSRARGVAVTAVKQLQDFIDLQVFLKRVTKNITKAHAQPSPTRAVKSSHRSLNESKSIVRMTCGQAFSVFTKARLWRQRWRHGPTCECGHSAAERV